MRELLQIGEVARLVGISTKTIRYYHEIGLLAEPERTRSGYRLYTAQHLLRLQRIRRLRALGLALERIREILNEAPENNGRTLRAALYSLVEETTMQIFELEERRTFLQKLLSGEELEPAEEGTHLFYSSERKADLTPYLAHLNAESLAWGQRLDAMLGSFNWPAEYRQGIENFIQHIADHAEEYRHLFALEARFTALADLTTNDPEIERLAEAYAHSPELPLLTQQMAQFGVWEGGPLTATFSDLTTSMLAPAQQRFFELLSKKILPRHSNTSSTTTQES